MKIEDIKIYNDREFQKGAKFPPCISVICYFWILDPPATNWFSLFCEACILQCLVSSQLICSVFCSVFLSTWGLSKEETLLWPIVQLKSFNERLPSYLGTPIYVWSVKLVKFPFLWEPESELIISLPLPVHSPPPTNVYLTYQFLVTNSSLFKIRGSFLLIIWSFPGQGETRSTSNTPSESGLQVKELQVNIASYRKCLNSHKFWLGKVKKTR